MGGRSVAHIFKERGAEMKNGLSGFKNILWAVSILLVLLALLVGLIFAMSQKNKDPRQDGTITLGEIERKSRKDDAELAGLDAAAEPQLKELPATSKNNMESVFGMTFLCDKTVAALKTYCDNYVDSVTAQIWTDNRTGLSAKAAAETPIVFVDGSLITPDNAAMISRPKTLVIYLGGDDLANSTEQELVEGYIRLIDSIREASPDTTIIVCSIASISSNYQGTDGLTVELIAQANIWIRHICMRTGVYYADIASFLNTDDGHLSDTYLTPDGRSIAAAGIALIVDYFRFHGV